MANTNPTYVVTGKVRLSYTHLFEAYRATPEAKPKFSTTILLPKSDAATKAAIDTAIRAALEQGRANGKFDAKMPLDKLPTPIYDGDGYKADGYSEFGPECKGHWVFTASCDETRRPQVVDSNGKDIIDPSQVYSGMYARVSMNFYPYAAPARKGVGCSLGNVMKVADGEPLGAARRSAADDFGFAPGYDPLS